MGQTTKELYKKLNYYKKKAGDTYHWISATKREISKVNYLFRNLRELRAEVEVYEERIKTLKKKIKEYGDGRDK